MTGQCTCSEMPDDEVYAFGADGELITAADAPGMVPPPFLRPCPIDMLDGSWLFEVERTLVLAPIVRGPMRIEVGEASLRVSGDMYSRRTILPPVEPVEPSLPPLPDPQPGDAARAGDVPLPGLFPWYPSFPKSEYSWYFRSERRRRTPAARSRSSIVRHLWNRATQEFVSTDQRHADPDLPAEPRSRIPLEPARDAGHADHRRRGHRRQGHQDLELSTGAAGSRSTPW